MLVFSFVRRGAGRQRLQPCSSPWCQNGMTFLTGPDGHSCASVLGLAGMELIFPVATLVLLCFALVARKVFWLLLSRAGTASRLSLQRFSTATTSSLGVGGRIWGRDILRTADPKLTKGIFHTVWHLLSNKKLRERRRKGKHLFLWCLSSRVTAMLLKPCFPGSGRTSPADGKERISLLVFLVSSCSLLLY